jgi:hypothetical protein
MESIGRYERLRRGQSGQGHFGQNQFLKNTQRENQ